jgi:hypothetical protein
MGRMISCSYIRVKGAEEFPAIVRQKTSAKALEDFVIHELSFGGVVVEVSEIKVLVKTAFFDCVDTTAYEGTEEEMKRIVDVAGASGVVNSRRDSKGIDLIAETLGKVTGGTIPLPALMAVGLSIGDLRAKSALISAFSQYDHTKELMKRSVENCLTILSLVDEGTCSFEQALELVIEDEAKEREQLSFRG